MQITTEKLLERYAAGERDFSGLELQAERPSDRYSILESYYVMVFGRKPSRRKIMDANELLQRYSAGERNFTGINLKGANISGSNPMEDIFVFDVDLSEINLSGSDLTGAILAGANLSGANFSNANLSRSDLSHCNLTNVNLSYVNLSYACLDVAKFWNTDLSNTQLYCASIIQTQLAKTLVLGAKNFRTVDWTGTKMTNIVLDDGTIINCDHDW
ncbi:pentapeptide repeat-containing protein [Okeania sp. SIO2B3]|uniref:pentapeptide repeat-containing protein n=1 Tax=Okeania sp. SIO2B3 TaxID=2607784 RepID=UPI0025FFA84A|nr:pentapeptide repeat-containing protein [Okeania sp. SIO2B3]